jgi:hypothetical protein
MRDLKKTTIKPVTIICLWAEIQTDRLLSVKQDFHALNSEFL